MTALSPTQHQLIRRSIEALHGRPYTQRTEDDISRIAMLCMLAALLIGGWMAWASQADCAEQMSRDVQVSHE